jgi:esterase/lipase
MSRSTTLRNIHSIAAAAIAAVALSACGGSSKPSYCSKVSDLESSVKALGNLNVIQNGTSSLKTALQKVQSSAQDAVSAAKSDFPNETKALNDAVGALKTSVDQITGTPTPAAVAALAKDAAATVTAVQNLVQTTSSKCK